PTEKIGERHSLTSQKSRLIHKLLQNDSFEQQIKLYNEFSLTVNESFTAIRHFLSVDKLDSIESDNGITDTQESILKLFGSGGMSFGAISAESQRDLILAYEEIGGRCNSGEGGENPYFEKENISANVKQIASGRFGVTAEYLVNSEEVQIKIAQGAKPGEGGQLMGLKVTTDIAKARYSKAGVDLISPPPHHDIYSIEDLKQLIYELKQLKPQLKVSVKLVAGKNIGAISVGVAKAGADIIMVSGGEGGTGAANLLSMKHAGLPFEVGLIEVHHALVESGFRNNVTLRTDGGLLTGKDIVLATILGADEFDFGKILLVSQGCIMARVCEKNTCPTGIATHNVKFKKNYNGNKEKVVTILKLMAEQTLQELTKINATSLKQIKGKTQLLGIKPNCSALAESKGLSLDYFKDLSIENTLEIIEEKETLNEINPLNKKVLEGVSQNSSEIYPIISTDRAIPMSLCGSIAGAKINKKKSQPMQLWKEIDESKEINLNFIGSAGQGFGIFLPQNVTVKLQGEANDSVGKGLSGGKVHVLPHPDSNFDPIENTIIGNGALYGATSGELFAYGKGGDRFAVRNSGASAVIEGVGIHALEYMTGGRVIILGSALGNVGAGMTGGVLYIASNEKDKINHEYLIHVPFLEDDFVYIREKLDSYLELTKSPRAREVLKSINQGDFPLSKFLPKNISSNSD
ncbi:glutamate synthase-related protein, partial [Bacteriovoracaceae bacterium]|nr:glutamate synthase-related protein [Bacteriovoracaceae bacterium]